MTVEAGSREGYLQIGEAADSVGLTQRTLRYYEEKGLLEPPSRMEGGFRLYSPADVDRLSRITELKSLLGFSLAEIKNMLEAEDIKERIRAGWRKDADAAEKADKIRRAREVTLEQLKLIEQKMTRMSALRDELRQRLARYDDWLRQKAPGQVETNEKDAASRPRGA
ncbi:MAG: MerR family transcriptional regulator [Dehalococcoidia bacterium]